MKTTRLTRNLFFVLESRRRIRAKKQLPPPFVVCSPGGVATTALIEHARKFVEINHPDDLDGLKHLSSPRLVEASRVVYISGPADRIIQSLERRGFLRYQSIKLGASPFFLAAPKSAIRRKMLLLIEEQRQKFAANGALVVTQESLHLPETARAIAEYFTIQDLNSFVGSYPIHEKARP